MGELEGEFVARRGTELQNVPQVVLREGQRIRYRRLVVLFHLGNRASVVLIPKVGMD